MAFHDAGEAASLGGAHNIHARDVLEYLAGGQNRADLGVSRGLEPELTNIALRLAVGLFGKLLAGLGAGPAAFRNEISGDVAAFGADRLFARLVFIADLHGMIAVALG